LVAGIRRVLRVLLPPMWFVKMSGGLHVIYSLGLSLSLFLSYRLLCLGRSFTHRIGLLVTTREKLTKCQMGRSASLADMVAISVSCSQLVERFINVPALISHLTITAGTERVHRGMTVSLRLMRKFMRHLNELPRWVTNKKNVTRKL